MSKFSSSAYLNYLQSRFEASVNFVQTSLRYILHVYEYSFCFLGRSFNKAVLAVEVAILKGSHWCNYLGNFIKITYQPLIKKVFSWNVVLKMSHSDGSILNLIPVYYLILTQERMLLLGAFLFISTPPTTPVSKSELLGFINVLPA